MTQPTPPSRSADDIPPTSPDPRVLSPDKRDPPHNRALARVDLAIPVAVYEINGCVIGNPMSCTCTNFSQSGFRVRCRKVMYAGQVLAMILPQKTGAPKVFFGVLRDVRYGESGRYDLGVELCPVPDNPAVRAWATHQSQARKAA
ncbi:MAG: hypothetical protein ACREJO_15005 [Phycisphaerales bacterium]